MKKSFYYNILLLFADIIAVNIAFLLAFYLRFENNFMLGVYAKNYLNIYFQNAIIFTLINISVFYFFGMYKSLWKYASTEELVQVIATSFVATAAVISYGYIAEQELPRSVYLITFLLNITLIGGIRFSYRVLRRIKNQYFNNGKNSKRIMVIGAGQAGAIVINELRNNNGLGGTPVAVIDDDRTKLNKNIHGVTVLGNRKDIKRIVKQKRIKEIIIAIPSASKKELEDILNKCSETKCKLRMLPGIYELIDGNVNLQKVRDVDIEDLLGREPVKVDLKQISGYVDGKTVLVTGGGGSIGSELCRQIAKFKPKQLIILDIYENNAYDIQNELKANYPELKLSVLIASIRDRKRIKDIFEKYRPELVFHAAAHKHVPLMESNSEEAIKNNVFGTLNVAECADEYGVKRFVLISTDKAVNPTNIMGATKRITEMIVQSLNKKSKTEFVAVRFGNVLGSNGSVIPLFKKQIAKGGPVTVTHKNITRFFMTIPEAAQLVIQAGAIAKGGEIFILDMGKPVKIIDLAEKLIRLSGFEPYKDIDIKVTGLRPGEKLYEELLMNEEGITKTAHNKIFIGKPINIDYKILMAQLDNLKKIALNKSIDIKDYMNNVVPTYKRKVEDDEVAVETTIINKNSRNISF